MAAYKVLESIGVRTDNKEEAKRMFHLARAAAGVKKYQLALRYNSAALTHNPRMLAAHYNNACYSALSRDRDRALFHINMLSAALSQHGTPQDYRRYWQLMQSDKDLQSVRRERIFQNYLSLFHQHYRAH